jgi:hypothetical protein
VLELDSALLQRLGCFYGGDPRHFVLASQNLVEGRGGRKTKRFERRLLLRTRVFEHVGFAQLAPQLVGAQAGVRRGFGKV